MCLCVHVKGQKIEFNIFSVLEWFPGKRDTRSF